MFLNDQMLFPPDEVEMIFDPVFDVYELSVQILASVEEVVEMASEMEEGARYPQIGFCFEDVAEVSYRLSNQPKKQLTFYVLLLFQFSSLLNSLPLLLLV